MKNSKRVCQASKTSWMGSSQKRHNPAVGQGWRNFINGDSKTSWTVFQISLFERKKKGAEISGLGAEKKGLRLGPHARPRFKYV